LGSEVKCNQSHSSSISTDRGYAIGYNRIYGGNMIAQTSNQGFLESPLISRIRRNHGLEHATLQVLAKHFPHQAMAGYSYPGGFLLVGNIQTEKLRESVEEALERLRNGEHGLAIHPGCGTNYLTTGVLAGLAGGVAMLGAGRRIRDRLERLPLAFALATLGVIISQPLGRALQEWVTTDGNPGDLQVLEIMRYEQGRLVIHRIRTRG
jgi:hypothetical protein